jgi:Activator of Hsp90 ATPase homolog 1-like protein
MEKLRQTIFINAPRERVWDVMLADQTYRDWTSAFHPGSYYRGDWSEGSKILFLGPNPEGGEGGMVSRIKENRLHEFISIEHLGIFHNGVEDTESAEAKQWGGAAFENYSFTDKDGGTELGIEMDIDSKEKENFEAKWQDALTRLKEIAEGS